MNDRELPEHLDGAATARQQIRALHEAWFVASHEKDLDASMAPFHTSVVTYEHSSPLRYTDIEAIREECRRGFDMQSDDFAWTVPDLVVETDGDLAVAWGLNRMANRREDGTEQVMWSRGTRVFKRFAQGWKMIHQHVSFPFDPATGAAATDLEP